MEPTTLNDTFTPKRTNGHTYTKRTFSNVNGQHQRSVNGKPPPRYNESKKKKSNEYKYAGEQRVFYAVAVFLGITGCVLAWNTATGWLVGLGQMLGFVASTFFVKVLYEGIKTGRYIGDQHSLAVKLCTATLAMESLTLLAKYWSAFVPAYLIIVSFTIPFLAISVFKLIRMDPHHKLSRIQRENEHRKNYLKELRSARIEQINHSGEVAKLHAAMKEQDKKNRKLLRKAGGWGSGEIIDAVVKNDLQEVRVKYLGLKVTRQKKKDAGKMQKMLGGGEEIVVERHDRKTLGPRADNAVNGRNCKNPDCSNKLTGNQKAGCSKACNQKIYRLRKKGVEL